MSTELARRFLGRASRASRERKNMAKYNRNSGKAWTPSEVRQVKQLANQNTPTPGIGLKLGRTAAAIYQKASEKGISLAPTNQSPYNRRK